jgi:uncharacterized protein (DUF433 family)
MIVPWVRSRQGGIGPWGKAQPAGFSEVLMEIAIIDRGDGPKIAGTRITVYDVYYYLAGGSSVAEIASILRASPEQVQAAVKYIEQHEAEVKAVHQEIEERNARGNPPEILAKLEETRAKMRAWLEARRPTKTLEENGAGGVGGR